MSDLVELLNNRNSILFVELAGLLHDIGKLSMAFLKYRQTWQDDPRGWWNDPHTDSYLHKHEVFKSLIPEEFDREIATVRGCDFGEPDFSIRKAVHDHHKEDKKIGPITRMLKAADGKDAAIDRNNPLFSAEQKTTIYRSNVFGFEKGRIITPEIQEGARGDLYKSLGTELGAYFDGFGSDCRQRTLDAVKDAFDQGISDTTRPQNDTSLWEHAYAVASILKVLFVHNLINKEDPIYEFKAVKFGILGIGWDGLKFISYGQKIGDIVARKMVIQRVKTCAREIIESKYPIGNTIYEDDDGIYFIVPDGFGSSEYKTIRSSIMKEIWKKAADESKGELQPQTVGISETDILTSTDTLTSVVRAIQDMKKKASSRFDSSEKGFKYFTDFFKEFKEPRTVCPICRLRPVEKEDASDKICTDCKGRRIQAAEKITKGDGQTVFIDEIIDSNNRAALIVARFGLSDWLGGKMIRSLFVTEAKGIQKEIETLGSTASFMNDEEKLRAYFKNTEYDYARIVEDIDSFSCSNPQSEKRARHVAFLYSHGRDKLVNPDNVKVSEIREGWDLLLKSAREEVTESGNSILLYNLLNAKSPTPSTILDVWATTERFFKEKVSGTVLKQLLPENERLRIKTKEDMISWPGTLDGEIIYKKGKKKRVEILFHKNRYLEVIGEKYGPDIVRASNIDAIRITDTSHEQAGTIFRVDDCVAGVPFVPYRVITETPNIYVAIVPANVALEVTNLIYKKYLEEFGKVIGRLPLSVGNIFFHGKMPMFVVLDSGKRMLGNFQRLAEEEGVKEKVFEVKSKDRTADHTSFQVETSLGKGRRTLCWNLPSKLGDCKDDHYHPYFVFDSKSKDPSTRPTFFKTVVGDVVHFTEIEEGDKLCLKPNYYDFEFLDSNIRRHDIGFDKDLRRASSVAGFRSKPFLLDELDQKIMRIWKDLIRGGQLPGITDSKLRNLQSLWLTKYQEWGVNFDNPDTHNFRRWMQFVEASIDKEFPDIGKRIRNILLETIKNGVFFDMLELYLAILKMKVQA